MVGTGAGGMRIGIVDGRRSEGGGVVVVMVVVVMVVVVEVVLAATLEVGRQVIMVVMRGADHQAIMVVEREAVFPASTVAMPEVLEHRAATQVAEVQLTPAHEHMAHLREGKEGTIGEEDHRPRWRISTCGEGGGGVGI